MVTITGIVEPEFNPNALNVADKAAARFPLAHETIRGMVTNPDSYLRAMQSAMGDLQTAIGSVYKSSARSQEYVAKALGISPQAYSYASISYMPDVANAGLMQWPGINPDSLTKIAQDNIAPALIINSRVSDVARYAQLSNHPWRPGWHVETMDAKETPSASTRRDIKEAESFIYNCNIEYGYSDARQRDAYSISPFEEFLRKSVRDMMRYDGWAIWTNMDRGGRVIQFQGLPASQVRLANPKYGYKNDPKIFAALVDETGNPITGFTRDELVWKVRNPRNDPDAWGYGYSEIEMGVRLIQAFQSAIDLNASTFDRSGIPNAIMQLKGDFWNQDQIDLMQREWVNMKRGVSKTWGVPVIAVPEGGEIEITSLNDIKGTDVRYKDHMNMMLGMWSIITQFPARRLGTFTSGNHRDNQPLPDESVEIQGVDDPGMPPLLYHISDVVNEYLLWNRWPHLRFIFSNIDPKSDAREYEAKKQAATWKESRAEADLDDLVSSVPDEIKPLMEIMQYCPEDPNKAGVFQNLASVMLKAQLGIETNGSDEQGGKGPRMQSKVDPAKSRAHGHIAGVRRNSGRERARSEVSHINARDDDE